MANMHAINKDRDDFLSRLIVWPTTNNEKTLQVIGKNGWYSPAFTPEQLDYLRAHKDSDDSQYHLVDGIPERWKLKGLHPDPRAAVHRYLHQNLLTPEEANQRLIKMTGGVVEAAAAKPSGGDGKKPEEPAHCALGARADTVPFAGPVPSPPAPAQAPAQAPVNKPADTGLNLEDVLRKELEGRRPAIAGERQTDDWETDPDQVFKRPVRDDLAMAPYLVPTAAPEAAAAPQQSKGWVVLAGNVASGMVNIVGNVLGAKSFEPEDAEKNRVIAHNQQVIQELMRDNRQLREERGLPVNPPPPPPLNKETQDEKIARLEKLIKDLREDNENIQKQPKITPTAPPPPQAAAATLTPPAMAPAMAAGAPMAAGAHLAGAGVMGSVGDDSAELIFLRDRIRYLEQELQQKNDHIRQREMEHTQVIGMKDIELQGAAHREAFLQRQAQDLNVQIQALQASKPAGALDVHNLRQQKGQLELDLVDANTEIARLKAQLAAAPVAPPSASPDVARLQAELLQAQNEIANLKANPSLLPLAPPPSVHLDVESTPVYKDLLVAFNTVSTEAVDLKAQVFKLKKEIQVLSSQGAPALVPSVSNDRQCVKLQGIIDDLNDKMTKLSLRNDILQKKVTELTNDKSDQTSVSESREERIRGLKAENARLTEEKKHIKKLYQALLEKHGEGQGDVPKAVQQMYDQHQAAKRGAAPPDRFRRY